MGSTWAAADTISASDHKNWCNLDTTNNESIKQATSAPEEVDLTPEELDLNPEDVQDGDTDWTVTRKSEPSTQVQEAASWTVEADPS